MANPTPHARKCPGCRKFVKSGIEICEACGAKVTIGDNAEYKAGEKEPTKKAPPTKKAASRRKTDQPAAAPPADDDARPDTRPDNTGQPGPAVEQDSGRGGDWYW